ncbi:hypothetical protein [Agrococcus sp. SGAir0287]|uniref:hypothetical protein n=1 Tax=Agrococcus sp. SGAir0287 TaxID=2070347 RepID=UPI0010CD4EFA|nr:hypothetical protein [Agrococcus sp. SGAir0287]QCR19832.1 hypothetical protein C1N71_10645 [Agrococcus sp. SGAir0287]
MTTASRTTRTALALLAAAGLALTAACSSTTSPGASGDPTDEPTSSTSPSPIDSAPPAAGDPTPIPDDDPRLSDAMGSQTFPIVEWAEEGTTIAVLVGGSGSAACVPSPVGATVESATAITVEFTPPDGDMMCTADFRVYGWEIPLTGEVDATQTIEVTVDGLTEQGEPTVVPLAP